MPSRKSILFRSYFNPHDGALGLLSSCRIKCKRLGLIKPHLLPLLSPLPRVLSTFTLISSNTSFCVVLLWRWTSHSAWWWLVVPSLWVNCSFFKNQHKCHLFWGFLALPGRVSAFSACYLYLLCDLLFCTVIMPMPVFFPRLPAAMRRDRGAPIFVPKAENGVSENAAYPY